MSNKPRRYHPTHQYQVARCAGPTIIVLLIPHQTSVRKRLAMVQDRLFTGAQCGRHTDLGIISQ
jgi:hypothetical protein